MLFARRKTFRLYHRRDGRGVKEREDLMSATRYGVTMLRYAECLPRKRLERSTNYFGAGSWMAH